MCFEPTQNIGCSLTFIILKLNFTSPYTNIRLHNHTDHCITVQLSTKHYNFFLWWMGFFRCLLLYQIFFLRKIQLFSNKTPIRVYSIIHDLGLVSASTTPWECTGWYCVLCNKHSWISAQRMYRTLGFGSFSHLQTSSGFCQDAFG